MWRKLLRILGFLIGCGVICAYICYASHLAQAHRAEQRVTRMVVSIADSTETRQFASSVQIANQLKRKGLDMVGKSVDSVDAVKLSNYILRKGFVREADVYVTYAGEMYVDIKQHKPVARLLCGGLNSYVTSDGDTFSSPQGAAYYTAVVTGVYAPLFVTKGRGSVKGCYDSLVAKEDRRLAKLGEDYADLDRLHDEAVAQEGALRKDKKRKFLESRASQEQRHVALNIEIAKCKEEQQRIEKRMAQLEQRRYDIAQRKKKLARKYEDFGNLINFVSEICNDSFWGAEVVQFVADTTSTGEISLRMVPRSGDFVITFGTLADSDVKMHKLQEFYKNGLSRFGWERFKSVDLRYDKQVICTE